MERIKSMPEQHVENRIDEGFPPENINIVKVNPDDIKITVHDMSERDDLQTSSETKIHMNSDEIFDSKFDTIEEMNDESIPEQGQ
jgi:hypothetical protein